MEVTVRDIYNSALAIMHESDTEDYAARVPAIVNTLIGQCWSASEQHQFGPHSHWTPVTGMDSAIEGVDISLSLSAMPYGLAAMLFLDEDPQRSDSWWQVWQEALAMFRRNRPAEIEPIRDVYGGFGGEDYGRW